MARVRESWGLTFDSGVYRKWEIYIKTRPTPVAVILYCYDGQKWNPDLVFLLRCTCRWFQWLNKNVSPNTSDVVFFSSKLVWYPELSWWCEYKFWLFDFVLFCFGYEGDSPDSWMWQSYWMIFDYRICLSMPPPFYLISPSFFLGKIVGKKQKKILGTVLFSIFLRFYEFL